ncbi:plasmid pRiA4b ORF-3 family protein [Bacillus sp. DJP31]|uniref:plasmid pRiA4b ORF-3 family protein n=1 Tax=Bacillus sp. DJP31 TaxID=3409789 RepID=UPI003BB65AF5
MEDSTTFSELHTIIQVSFEWQDAHLHGFEVRKTNGQAVGIGDITIGPADEEKFGITFGIWRQGQELDEKKVRLCDYFVSEKDRCLYTYDFGDDWEHDVVLEKVLSPDPRSLYPLCTKAIGDALLEGVGDFFDESEMEVSTPDEIRETINDNLQSLQKAALVNTNQTTSWADLFALSDEFKKLQPWNWLDDDQIFGVKDPLNNEMVYCSVMGAAGQEYGVAAYEGEEGVNFLHKIIRGEGDNQDVLIQRSIIFSLSDREELSPEDYELIKREGLSYRGKRQWPQFRSFLPGYYPWHLTDEEATRFIGVLKQVIEVCQQVKEQVSLVPRFTSLEKVPVLVNGQISWKNDVISQQSAKEQPLVELLVSEVTLKSMKKNFKKYNTPLEIDLFLSTKPAQDQPGERPYFPYILMVVERRNGMIVHTEFLPRNEIEVNVQKELLSIIQKLNGIPRELWIQGDEMKRLLLPVTQKLGISLFEVKTLPNLKQARNAMFSFM